MISQGTHSGRSPQPVRVGRIGFINVDPVYYGIEHMDMADGISLCSAAPAQLNRMMAEERLDISAVSSAAFGLHHRDWLLLPNMAVACTGNVMSVLLVSREPISALRGKTVSITDESDTAAALLRLMLSHEQICVREVVTKVRSPDDIQADTCAALVIGDSAMRHDWHRHFPHVFDLGDLWLAHAGLPFVFAVWAVRRTFAASYPENVISIWQRFQASKQAGLQHLDVVVRMGAQKLGIPTTTITRYFNNFCFDMGPQQELGLKTFFTDLHRERFFNEAATVSYIPTNEATAPFPEAPSFARGKGDPTFRR